MDDFEDLGSSLEGFVEPRSSLVMSDDFEDLGSSLDGFEDLGSSLEDFEDLGSFILDSFLISFLVFLDV